MSRASTAETGRQRVAPVLSLSRLGDIGLAILWSVLSIGSITRTIADAPKESWLGTTHQAVSAIILCLTTILFVIRRPTKARATSWQSRTIAIVGSWMMPAVILMPLTWTPGWVLTLCTVGLVVTHLVVFWSLFTLRRSFSVFAEARALVRTGPYAVVRHPLYTTYTVMYLFFLLPRLSVWSVALVVFAVGCEVWRAREEERVLRATFPEYSEYAKVTPRFVPRLSSART